MKGGLLTGWRRWRARRSDDSAVTILDAAEGYRCWAASYADQTNELQQMEAELRRPLQQTSPGLRILDAGAGTGRVTDELTAAGGDVFAVDLVAEMLLQAPNRAAMSGRVCVARVEALPFPSESFDQVVCALTLGHVPDLAAALSSMVRVLRPGGTLIVSDFHPDATLRGWQRSFSSAGRTWAVEQHAHSIDAYDRNLASLGCCTEELGEQQWRGKTVLFGLRARKRASASASSGDGGASACPGRRRA